jgi:diguanylate cyclase (GGDEF)-like protein/PAS domain S-box-containing protein
MVPMERRSLVTYDPAISLPIDHLCLFDLISLKDLQQLQDSLAEITGVSSIITDPEGNALSLPSNPNAICTLIADTPEGAAMCRQNDQALNRQVKLTRRSVCRSCGPFGFLNAAVPIIVNDLHLANWWIKQPCSQESALARIPALTERIGVSGDRLTTALKSLPQCHLDRFEKVLVCIDGLARKITRLGFECYALSQDLSKLHCVENELQKYKSHLEVLVQERTAALIKANKRLQLEVMERNLVEEQIERKSRLLDAINQILQHTLTDRSNQVLSHTFLKTAQELTCSVFGFIVEYQENGWNIIASDTAFTPPDTKHLVECAQFEVIGTWREVIEKGRPLIVTDPAEQPGQGLPKFFPRIANLLVVPLRENHHVSGFIALANNPREYALVDQQDTEALGRAYMEAILRKRSEQAKDTSEKRLNLALESANEGLWDYFPLNGQIYYSPNWFVMLGYQVDEFPNSLETWATLTHPEDLPVLENALGNAANGSAVGFGIEIRMLAKHSNWRWIQARGRSVETEEDGKVVRIVGTLSDISKYKQVETALQKANEELQRLAALDGLTQIANRMRFEDRLTQEWRRALREKKSLALIICDIDYFKSYNDAYGHLKGDEALYTVAQSINAALKRPMDLAARYGGEEFGMILPNTDISGATRVANEVKAAVDDLQIEHQASPVGRYLSLSFGVSAMIPVDNISLKALIASADQALYKAKALGRDRIVAAAQEPSPAGMLKEIVDKMPALPEE